MIHVEYREIKGSNRDKDLCIFRCLQSEIPKAGETVSIEGNSYVVTQDIGWAISKEQELYCYIRVTKLFDYIVKPDECLGDEFCVWDKYTCPKCNQVRNDFVVCMSKYSRYTCPFCETTVKLDIKVINKDAKNNNKVK